MRRGKSHGGEEKLAPKKFALGCENPMPRHRNLGHAPHTTVDAPRIRARKNFPNENRRFVGSFLDIYSRIRGGRKEGEELLALRHGAAYL